MKLAFIDIAIILTYLASTVVIGLVLKKKAERSKKDYLLGGNNIPWYLLGLSNASGMFDISGTMWLVTLLFVYGLKSAWIPFLWPVFNQIFLMVFMSIWLRKSNVTTGAEWLRTRFSGKGERMSHSVMALSVSGSLWKYLFLGRLLLHMFLLMLHQNMCPIFME
jgi:solute:Na+ symporter, SSS family